MHRDNIVGASIIVGLVIVGIFIAVSVLLIILDKKENGKRKKGPIVSLISLVALLGVFFGGLKIIDSVNTSGDGSDNKDGNPFLLTMSVVSHDISVVQHKKPVEALLLDTFVIEAKMNITNLKMEIEFYIGGNGTGTLLDTAEVKVGNLKRGEQYSFIVSHTDTKCLLITSYKMNITKGTTSFLDWFIDPDNK